MLAKASCCKVNLLLNILGKRPDGYHELETVIHPVDVCDRLEFERAGNGIHLTCSDPRLPVNSKNLVFRASALFLQSAGVTDGIRIHLHKKIPVAAGLGGGSGNAAVTLLALNELFGYPLEPANLAELAASLGSDIPFFLQSNPALATGRGEVITPLSFFPALSGTYMVLVHPGFGISTPWAYEQLAKFPAGAHGTPGRAQCLISLLQTDLPAAAREFYNSLELPALRKYPLLEMFQEDFRQNGALSVLMSGSGSTTFALAESKPVAENLLEKLKAKFGANLWTATVKTAPE
ncbi:MAG TPA: 4-(cytidine 5'-diphospho)-2-C-methyl-D-erythritol kinase [Candidatus Baltobacteraceae bacterium]|jgi:4-diphosphocytidyl-2-C-methyl-D-erythritol kinase|nr:4-(cytidine 5'-diphospho)-2-C-methyl-D-erythritol kinase [Candidatus Baltobacteraceae bacterium]